MPKAVETEEIHFLDGLIGKPAIMRHSIGSNKNSSSIMAKAAVDKNLFVLIFEKRKKLGDLVVGWRSPAADGNVDEANAERFGLFTLPGNFVGIFAAKVNDGSDAESFELLKAFGTRLRAAKERIVYFPGVGNAGKS